LRYAISSILAVLSLLASGSASYAQEAPSRLALDVSGGYAAFVDESPIPHFTFGGGVRWQLSPGVSLGPEVVFMKGPADDRDVFLTGKVVVDFLPRRVVSPYFVADGGAMLHGTKFSGGPYWVHEGAVSAGAGARIDVTPHLSIAPEFRIGWEPHLRVGVRVTWRP